MGRLEVEGRVGHLLGMGRNGEGQNGGDQEPAAPVWHGHASGGHTTGHADIGIGMFLSA